MKWKLVPVEPTREMLVAACKLDLSYMPDHGSADRGAVYDSMLAASPSAADDAELVERLARAIAADDHVNLPTPLEPYNERSAIGTYVTYARAALKAMEG